MSCEGNVIVLVLRVTHLFGYRHGSCSVLTRDTPSPMVRSCCEVAISVCFFEDQFGLGNGRKSGTVPMGLPSG